MNRRSANLLVWLSLLMMVVTLCTWVISTASGEHWEYFAIYSRMPTIVEGDIEFGWLSPAKPYVPVGPNGLGMNGPFNIGKHWPQPPAVSTDWKSVWRFVGLEETRGLLIPPWGWNQPPTYEVKHDEVSIFGSSPHTVIPFRTFHVPLFYVMILFALPPMYRFWKYLRWLIFWKPGTCEVCGYDLRATPERCPECGTVPKTKTGQTSC